MAFLMGRLGWIVSEMIVLETSNAKACFEIEIESGKFLES